MPRKRVYQYKELVKLLLKYDKRFEIWVNRAKGSERMIYHPDIQGRPQQYPVKYHGNKTEIRTGHLLAIIRRFRLPKDFF